MRRALLVVLILLSLLLGVVAFFYLRGFAGASQLRSDWEALHGTEASWQARFTRREANESALAAERAAWRLGLDLRVIGTERARRPPLLPPDSPALDRAKSFTESLGRRLRGDPVPQSARFLPEAIGEWALEHEAGVQGIERVLLEAEPPAWERDGGLADAGRGPPPLATAHLHRLLLGRALQLLASGELEEADGTLLAAWRLVEEQRGRPGRFWELAHATAEREALAVLRRHPRPGPDWPRCLAASEPLARRRRQAALDTLDYVRALENPAGLFHERLSDVEGGEDGWADAFLRGRRSSAADTPARELSEPYVRAVVSSALSLHFEYLEQVDAAGPCEDLVALHRASHRSLTALEPGARWLVEKEFSAEPWRAAQQQQHELELTRWAVSVRRRLQGGGLPEALPACGEWWEREEAADGGLRLSFVGPVHPAPRWEPRPELSLSLGPDGASR